MSTATSEVAVALNTSTEPMAGGANSSSPSSSAEYQGLFSPPLLAVVTTTSVLLFAFGVLGNSMTIAVFSRTHEMRTTTYLYLSSMAVSDLLIFSCMPFDLYRLWRYRPWLFGDFLCRCFQYVSESCTYATILHITALSVERYLAICFPLWAKVAITRRRVRALILGLWALALGSAGPVISIVSVQVEKREPVCKVTDEARKSGRLEIITWMSTAYFFLPVFCLAVLYGLIGRRLWLRRTEAVVPCMVQHEKAHRQTVRMLVAVVVAFVVCWLPFHVGRLIFAWHVTKRSQFVHDLSQYLNLTSFVLFYLSSAINPLLYNFMSRKYRAAARRLVGPGLAAALCPRARDARSLSGRDRAGLSGSSAGSSYRRRARSVSSSVQEDSTQAFVLDPGSTAV
ncbi:growth hormone secretagogue receptor type 1 [Petromyzon marinus]|uniref:Growth hormone secretagogue receptor type 1 n=1 Tax=Petromyzon marinus TaxID=7757 RepID=A0AAJ7U9G4_PETMA|nr:growth hormone secretagogue receptor type 1-like [Petromyzon marinus]